MKIKVELNDNDVRELVYHSFCNGGLQQLAYSSIKVDWNNGCNKLNYSETKARLKKENPDKSLSYEYILTEMFVTNGVYFRDYEDYDDSNNYHFTFDIAKSNLEKALDSDNAETLIRKIQKAIPVYVDADAYDYDYILQTAMYGELVYG